MMYNSQFWKSVTYNRLEQKFHYYYLYIIIIIIIDDHDKRTHNFPEISWFTPNFDVNIFL